MKFIKKNIDSETKRKYFARFVQSCTLIATVILTFMLLRSNNRSAEIAEHTKNSQKFRTTRELCYDFNNRYWMFDDNYRLNHPIELDYLHLWIHSDRSWTISKSVKELWEKDTMKLDGFLRSIELNRILAYFEDAKMMDRSGYLDVDYFYNFFVSTVRRFLQAKNPTFSEYIDKKRKYEEGTLGDPNTWDGFDYCLINIFIPKLKKEDNREEIDLFQNGWDNSFKKYEKLRKENPIEVQKKE